MQFSTKKDYAYEQIRNDIMNGKLKPNTKLVISNLAQKYEMSPIPIREALSQLFHEGLIQNVPYTGARVANLDLENLIEITVVRTEMECLALRVALPFLTDADVAASRELLKQLNSLYKEGNLRDYIVVNRSFYVSLFSYAPYKHLQAFVKEPFTRTRINTSLIAPHHIPGSLQNHEKLLQAIEARDTETAVRLYRGQKNRALNAVLDVMKEVLLDPNKLSNSPASAFYTEEDVRENRDTLLAKLDWLRKLISSTET
jgi:DNA-binding GntR family transcriptional regulator